MRRLKNEKPIKRISEVFFLPILSEIGPPKSWPKAKPNIKKVKDNSIFCIPTPKILAIIGIEGVYVSIEMGAIEESAANITISSL